MNLENGSGRLEEWKFVKFFCKVKDLWVGVFL